MSVPICDVLVCCLQSTILTVKPRTALYKQLFWLTVSGTRKAIIANTANHHSAFVCSLVAAWICVPALLSETPGWTLFQCLLVGVSTGPCGRGHLALALLTITTIIKRDRYASAPVVDRQVSGVSLTSQASKFDSSGLKVSNYPSRST